MAGVKTPSLYSTTTHWWLLIKQILHQAWLRQSRSYIKIAEDTISCARLQSAYRKQFP